MWSDGANKICVISPCYHTMLFVSCVWQIIFYQSSYNITFDFIQAMGLEMQYFVYSYWLSSDVTWHNCSWNIETSCTDTNSLTASLWQTCLNVTRVIQIDHCQVYLLLLCIIWWVNSGNEFGSGQDPSVPFQYGGKVPHPDRFPRRSYGDLKKYYRPQTYHRANRGLYLVIV